MEKQVRPFLIAEDLSAVSQISLSAALPIFTKADIPVALAPTSLLSSQTEGFGAPITQDMSNWLTPTFAHWRTQRIELAGALIGYLGSQKLCQFFETYLKQQNLPLVVIDPVMGDGGQLYPKITPDHVQAMRQLIGQAHVITPNLTEAQFLAEKPLTPEVDRLALIEIFEALSKRTAPDTKIVITGIPDASQIATIWRDQGHFYQLTQPKLSGHFYGSGDVFAALLACHLSHQVPFSDAVRRSTRLVHLALTQTAEHHVERRFGLQLSRLLDQLEFEETL